MSRIGTSLLWIMILRNDKLVSPDEYPASLMCLWSRFLYNALGFSKKLVGKVRGLGLRYKRARLRESKRIPNTWERTALKS